MTIKGGQGRTGESVMADACVVLLTIIAATLVVVCAYCSIH